MPKVGKKEFDYDDEGIAAAEAASAATGEEMVEDPSMVDKVEDVLADVGVPAEEPEPALEEDLESEVEEPLPDEGLLMQLFEVVYREDFDPDNPEHQGKLAVIQGTLDENPDMAEGLKTGDVTLTEFARRVYRGMPPTQEAPTTTPPVTPEPAGSSYFA